MQTVDEDEETSLRRPASLGDLQALAKVCRRTVVATQRALLLGSSSTHPLLLDISDGGMTAEDQTKMIGTIHSLITDPNAFDHQDVHEEEDRVRARLMLRLRPDLNGETDVVSDVVLASRVFWDVGSPSSDNVFLIVAMLLVEATVAKFGMTRLARGKSPQHNFRYLLKALLDDCLAGQSGPGGGGYRFPDQVTIDARLAEDEHLDSMSEIHSQMSRARRIQEEFQAGPAITALLDRIARCQLAKESPFDDNVVAEKVYVGMLIVAEVRGLHADFD
jgi:hypothetical protein